MKKGQYVRISKIKAVDNPIMPTPEMNEYQFGQENGNVSLPIDYWAEGYLLEDIKVNNSVFMDRRVRNGVKALGFMQTSKITKINGNLISTLNSVYRIDKASAV